MDQIIEWLTGYSSSGIEKVIDEDIDLENFFNDAPKLNPKRNLITGKVCGVKVEDIEETTMQEIRYLDKLIDELAKGKSMDKILRS